MTIVNTLKDLTGGLRSLIARSFREGADIPTNQSAEWSSTHLPSEDANFEAIWNLCEPYTMTSFARGLALYRAVRYLVENGIPGDIIECGVWRGGSMMIAMAALKRFGAMDRRFRLFDTFEGMTAPDAVDVDNRGRSAESLLHLHPGKHSTILCYASLSEVKSNIAMIGYPSELIEYVAGDVRKTIPEIKMRPIALLRLDTDWYDSTSLELRAFYPYLCDRGVLIIDDYGHWNGARKAVDEYLEKLRVEGAHCPMLNVIDYTGRMAVK
jgi:O-methyltransferase